MRYVAIKETAVLPVRCWYCPCLDKELTPVEWNCGAVSPNSGVLSKDDNVFGTRPDWCPLVIVEGEEVEDKQ